jgi:hypothetical protein
MHIARTIDTRQQQLSKQISLGSDQQKNSELVSGLVENHRQKNGCEKKLHIEYFKQIDQ